ncbi:MAG: hypothetical protein A2X06_08045 [Bacteroidetes bacterium GWC2_40_22]|nr:MAG: hypothetical protein A2X06_08045 [Bacteroidetes bacterium GWC2_40_22]
MKKNNFLTMMLPLFILTALSVEIKSQQLPLNKWKYIEADNSRQKWGDWADPSWLRYFGLDIKDINRDGFKDIIAGRYFYLNPGGNMEGKWTRSDLGMNADGYLFVDVDGDEYADVIAEALPDVYWFEADNLQGTTWTSRKIGEIPKTDHVNGQGGRYAQLIAGTKGEVILAAQEGIWAATVPADPYIQSNWKFNLIIKTGSSEGIGVGDIDGDGDPDLVTGDMFEEDKDVSRQVYWHENPGSLNNLWVRHHVGTTVNAADRIEVADFNGDGKQDIAVSEEMYPGLEPLANVLVFTNPGNSKDVKWKRDIIFTCYSVNNLDAGDIDNDGDIDLVTCEHKGKDYRLLLFQNDGKGNFTTHVADKGHESHLGTQLADLDSDGDLDIVSIGWDHHKFLHVWRNDAIKSEISWKHLSTKTGELPVPNGGKEQTSCLVADLDKNGFQDFIITDRSVTPSVIWYRYDKAKWETYVIDNSPIRIEAGSDFLDIDKDGDLDIIFAGESRSNEVWWWENPYPKYDPKKPWNRYNIKKSGANKHHDIMTGDFDNDGAPEVVFWNQGANTLFIAEIPANPKKSEEWARTAVYVYDTDSEMEPRGGIAAYPGWRGRNEHEGLAKADIDGDGLIDIIGGGRWFKYMGDGKFRENLIDASYTFTRSAVGQFIEGGRPEVLLTIGDGLGPLYMYEWIEKAGSKTGTWVPKIVIETLYDGHTIDVLDFNGDGHLDIFSAEMKLNPNNPGAIRILLGDGKGNFVHHVVHGDIGCHEGKIFDFEGDGDYDILSKPYNWDAPRLDLFINETKK